MSNCNKNEDKFVEYATDVLEEFFIYDDFVNEQTSEYYFNESNKNNPVDQMLFEDNDIQEEENQEEDLEEEGEDKYANYNILSYQGQQYYVKKKNNDLPVYVMNGDLVQVGIISEHDINNIKMI